MPTTEERPPRYRLGPRSTRGLVAGWRAGQIGCVCVGLLMGLAFLRSVPGAAGGVLALAWVAGGVAVAAWPVGGRTIEQWAPTVARFAGAGAADGKLRPWLSPKRRVRGPLARLSLREARDPDGRPPGSIGLVVDAEAGTLTAVLPVGGTGFALAAPAERVERIAAWSGVLASLARDASDVHRIQWLSCTYPACLDAAAPGPTERLEGTGYARLLEAAAPGLWAHEVLVALTVRTWRAPRRGETPELSLLRRLADLDERLRGAGLSPGSPLSGGGLASVIKRSYGSAEAGNPSSWPWPVGIDGRWSRLRTDASWHAAYWVAEWPRCEVEGGFLVPLLLEPGLRRTVSITMAPLPFEKAVRRAERDRTEGSADAELRRRHGFALTARAVREQEARRQREAELAEGHAGYVFSGYVTVTAEDPDRLEADCDRMEQSAALAQLDVRRLYGAQEEGYCCSLPTGRGCR